MSRLAVLVMVRLPGIRLLAAADTTVELLLTRVHPPVGGKLLDWAVAPEGIT